MSTDISNFIHGQAELGDSDEEDYDEETGEVRRKANGVNGHFEDSSEEDEDDDEEEAEAVSVAFGHALLAQHALTASDPQRLYRRR